MEVAESLVLGKSGNQELCEDAVVVNDRFAAVLDGATSQIDDNEGEMSSGKKAVNRLSAVLERIRGDVDVRECFRELNAALADIYHEEGIYEKARTSPGYRGSAAAIVYSRARSELWMIGDCQALLDGEPFTAWRKGDEILSEVRAMFLESELIEGKSIADLREHDTGREYIREMLIRQKHFQNLARDFPYSYSVLDGFLDDVETSVQVHPVPTDCRYLVLASDGYPVLKPTLEESERELARIIAEDPLCFRQFKSTKGVYTGNLSFDDRSYVKIRL